MAADVNDIIVYGFGSWSSVNSIPTLGFGISAVSAPTVPGIECRVASNRLHYTVPENKLHFRDDNPE